MAEQLGHGDSTGAALLGPMTNPSSVLPPQFYPYMSQAASGNAASSSNT